MAKEQAKAIDRWASDLEALGKRLLAHAKAVSAAGADPFASRENCGRVDRTLDDIDVARLRAPADVRKAIEAQCVEGIAEFWQAFGDAAKGHGWEIYGATDRRLIARAFFIELRNDSVSVDGVPPKLTPYIPAIVGAIKPLVEGLAISKEALQEFTNLLADAYEAAGGAGEVSVESVYRHCVMLQQSAQFWATGEASRFHPLSRPVFRYRLSAILAENMRSTSGRELRLTPTVNRKEIWEVFSPTEGRVVQVGRMSFVSR